MSKSRNRKTTTKWNLFFSYLGVAYALVSGIFFIPLYLKAIPVDLYGAWLASGNVLVWLTAIDFGLTNVILQRVAAAYGRQDLEETGGYISSGLLLSVILAVAILIVGIFLNSNLGTLLSLTGDPVLPELQSAFALAVVGTALTFVGFSLSGVNNALQGSFGVGVAGVLAQIISLATIFLCLSMGYGILSLAFGVFSRGLSLVVGNLVYFLWRRSSERYPLAFKRNYFTNVARVLSVSSLGTIGFALSERMDAFLLTRMLNPEVVPAFVLTKRGPGVADMILGRPGNAFSPTIANLAGEGDFDKARIILSRLMRIIIWCTGLSGALVLSLNHSFVDLWVGSEFYAGNQVNLAIVALLLLGMPLRNAAVLCVAMGDIKKMALVDCFRGVVTTGFLVVGIYYFGLLGAALAPICGLLVSTMAFVPRSFTKLLRLNPADVKSLLSEFLSSSCLALCVGMFLPTFGTQSWIGLIGSGFFIVFAYALVLMLISSTFRCEARAFQGRSSGSPV